LIAVLVPLTALGIVAWSAAKATFTSHDWVLAALICVLAAASSSAAVWAHGVFADAAERERELHWLRDYRSREVAR
jgi:hypothetical protein